MLRKYLNAAMSRPLFYRIAKRFFSEIRRENRRKSYGATSYDTIEFSKYNKRRRKELEEDLKNKVAIGLFQKNTT